MSVLIKGMKMPRCCLACPLYYYDQDSEHDITKRCPVLDHAEILPSYRKRRDDCPLVEVPTPHGRLIDADEVKEHMDHVCDAGGWLEPVTKAVREYVKKNIDDEETIIEAEEEA